jgi:O-methyltransferase
VPVGSPEPHPGLTAARAASAVGPGPDADALRRAYLELLKLSLCDLAGTTTGSVGRMEDGVVASRELVDDQLRLRAAGMDWPLQGLTMVGLNRLDDLQSCAESIVRDGVEGDAIEAGAWRGGASILLRATLDSLGDDRTVWVADSFQGFPAEDEAGHHRDQWSVIDYLGVSLEEVQANFARMGCERGVRFLPGFFEETLPGLSDRRWALVRLDGDSYDATLLTLNSLYPGLSAGGYLIVDDYGALEECRQAVDEFRRAHDITEPLEQIDWTGVRWRRESEAPIAAPDTPAPGPSANGRSAARAVPRPPDAHVPTFQELGLQREAEALRERLAAAEAEIERLTGSPVAAPKAWLRRRLDRRRAP